MDSHVGGMRWVVHRRMTGRAKARRSLHVPRPSHRLPRPGWAPALTLWALGTIFNDPTLIHDYQRRSIAAMVEAGGA
jgi:hypothetical protein